MHASQPDNKITARMTKEVIDSSRGQAFSETAWTGCRAFRQSEGCKKASICGWPTNQDQNKLEAIFTSILLSDLHPVSFPVPVNQAAPVL